ALDENAKEIARTVAFALGRAREQLHERVDALDKGQREAFDALILSDVARQLWDDVQQIECPACASPATVEGENTMEGEPDFDKDGEVAGFVAWVQFIAHSLRCTACGLKLEN